MFSTRFFRNPIRIFTIVLFLLLSLAYAKTFAIGSPYQPGITNDPACQPNETNCFVQIIPNQTGNANKYLISDGTQTAWSPYTLVLSGNLNTSGAFTTTLTSTATTNVTLPTSGTLSTLAGVETLTNKTLTSPLMSLIIGGTTATSPLTLRSTSGTGTTGADIIFQTGTNGSTEAMRVLNSGNVGIGDTNPASKLTVNGDIRIKSGSGGAIVFADGTTINTSSIPGSAGSLANISDAIITGDSDANATGDVILKTASNDRFHILNGGNVGINTATPSALFSVGASSPFQVTNTGAVTALTYNGNTIPAGSDTITGRTTTDTLTNKSISGSTNTFTNIPNSALTNNSITINGSSISLGGSVTNLALTTTALSQFASTTSAQLAGVISDETGTGNLVYSNSPVFTTPNIGNATGNISGNSATVTTNANLTGPITSVGNATTVNSQTGTGSTFVMQTSPTLTTPNLGTPSALVGTNITGTAASLSIGGTAGSETLSTVTGRGATTNTKIGLGFAAQPNQLFVYLNNATYSPIQSQQDGAGDIANFKGNGGVGGMTILNNGNTTISGSLTAGAGSFTTGAFSNSVTTTKIGSATNAAFVATGTSTTGYAWNESNQTTDNKYWDAVVSGTSLLFRTVDDGITVGTNWLQVTRSGNANSTIAFTSPATSFSGSVTGGAASFTTGAFSGSLSVTRNDGTTGIAVTNAVDADLVLTTSVSGAATKYASIQSSVANRNLVLNATNGGSVAIGATSTLASVVKLEVGDGTGDTRSFFNPNNTEAVGVRNGNAGAFYFGASSAVATPDGVFSNASATELMRITGTGNVGIGTTSPNYTAANRTTVDINGTSSALLALSVGTAQKGYLFHDGTNLTLQNTAVGSFSVNTSGVTALTINSSQQATFANHLVVQVAANEVAQFNSTASTTSGLPYISVGEDTTPYHGMYIQYDKSTDTISMGRHGGQPLTGGFTFGGAATFAGSVSFASSSSIPTVGIANNADGLLLMSGASNGVRINNAANNAQLFKITDAGSSTFSGSIQTTGIGSGIIGPGSGYPLQLQAASGDILERFYSTNGTFSGRTYLDGSSGAYHVQIGSGDTYIAYNGNSWTTGSDATIKKDISEIPDALSKINSLNGYYFRYINDSESGNMRVGVIAQEVQSVLPEAVSNGYSQTYGRDILGVSYTDLVPLLINGIKQMDIKVESIPTLTDQTLYSKIADFLRGIAEQGTAIVDKVTAHKVTSDEIQSDHVQATELCIGTDAHQVCLNADQVQRIIDQQNNSTPPTTPTPVATPTPIPDSPPAPSNPAPDSSVPPSTSTPPSTPAPTCSDGIKNQDETGIDTGGVCTPPPAPTP